MHASGMLLSETECWILMPDVNIISMGGFIFSQFLRQGSIIKDQWDFAVIKHILLWGAAVPGHDVGRQF